MESREEAMDSTSSLCQWSQWQLLDSILPTGGFAHSFGLEASMQARFVTQPDDLRFYVITILENTASLLLPFVYAANVSPDSQTWQKLDQHLDATLTNEFGRKASVAQGSALMRVAASVFTEIPSLKIMRNSALSRGTHSLHHAPVFGLVCGLLGFDAETTQRAYMFITLRDIISAATRLNLVGPIGAAALQHEIAAVAEELSRKWMNRSFEEACQTCPLIDTASAAYWRGDKDRESLQRVYGISCPDHKSLKEYKDKQEEARKYDHREIGKQQNLFYFDELSPGIPNFEPHGYRIKLKLAGRLRDEYWKRGYEEVQTADMCKMELWETSGHAANYRKNMFPLKVDDQEYALKPMNCPCHCKMYAHHPRSYKDLPIRYAEFGGLHRNEASGALSGLIRVRGFEQDDAHIFCMKSQVKEVAKDVLEFIEHVYKILGFTYNVKLSTRPEEFIGEKEVWNGAEADLAQVLDEFFRPGAWELNEGDGAFYGPKIDITIFDAMGRKHQCATLQLDFQLPVKFDLTYASEDPNKVERPVIIHRAILGSFERMIAILTEHYKGKWPFWLSPYQVLICPVADRFCPYAEQIRRRIHDARFYVDVDNSGKTIDKKIREAQPFQYNYILVVGEKEAATGQVSVRQRNEYDDNNESKNDNNNISVMSVDDFLDHLRKETDTFSHHPISRCSVSKPLSQPYRLKFLLKFLV